MGLTQWRAGRPAGPLVQLLAWTGLWLVLVDGDLRHPALAAAVIAGAAFAARALRSPTGWRIRIPGALLFAPYFLGVSLIGAADVAMRAFRRRMPLAPDLVSHRLRLPEGSTAATFFTGIISLVPGTLCAEIGTRAVTVHVVDRRQPNRRRLEALERRVAALFGEPLEGGDGTA